MPATVLCSSPPSVANSCRGLFDIYQTRRACNLPVQIFGHILSTREPEYVKRGEGIKRRDLVFSGLSTALLVFPGAPASIASPGQDEDIKMDLVIDQINAYSFLYPVEVPSKKFVFKWVESRKPERYSSAAPLSPDARQRIVSERVDVFDNVIISVSIGPPNSQFLASKDKSTWSPKNVADSVLSDKSSLEAGIINKEYKIEITIKVQNVSVSDNWHGSENMLLVDILDQTYEGMTEMRVSTSQRMAESSVLDTHSTEVDGESYWYYEYLLRKSPTKLVQDSNIFRHYVASTAERDGYLFSLSASTLNKQWDYMGPFLQKTVASFRLLPPTDDYVPPYKDPWRFW